MAVIAQRLPVCTSPLVSARRNFQFLLLAVTATAASYARTAVNPLQETMRSALALSDNQMALLQGPAPALASVIVAIPLGLMVDRYTRVRLLLVFALSSIVGTVFTAVAPTFAVLFIARCLIGLAHTATSTVAFSLLADMYPPQQRGKASMVVLIGQFAGMATAFALGGMLATMFDSSPNGWRWAMLGLGSLLVPVTFLTLMMREPRRTGTGIENPSVIDALTAAWRYRPVILPLFAGSIMAEISLCAVLVWAAPALSRHFALSPARVGAIMSIAVFISGILGSTMGGLLADRCQRAGGPRRTLSILSGLALVSVPAGFFAVVSPVLAASALLVAFMVVVGALIVMVVALLTIVVPSELRGLCLAAMIGANTFFGVALAPLIVSLLSGEIGGPAMIGKALAFLCAAAGLFSAVMFAFGRQNFSREITQ
jgi:predicted MFS family arabinose efflux permease